jgi:DNA-binding NtrC family response regulator
MPRAAGETEPVADPGVTLLVVTRDAELYASVREAASVWKWTVQHTAEAIPSIAYFREPASIRIIIYDGDSIDGDWKDALTGIKRLDRNSCILLASGVSDPYLWDEVIRYGGYDVIAKSAGPEQIGRILHFAWFWNQKACQKH